MTLPPVGSVGPALRPGERSSVAARLAEEHQDGLLGFDKDLRITFWNRALEKICARRASEVVGRGLLEVLPSFAAESDRLIEVLSGAAGEWRPFAPPPSAPAGVFQALAVRLPETANEGAAGALIVRDVAAQRQSERERLESEIRFRTMADVAPVLLWMAGKDGLCEWFNQTWLLFTGRSLELEQGNGWAEGVHPEDFQSCMDTYLSAFVERKEFRMEYRLRRADGAFRWILDTGRPRFGTDGGFLGYIGSCIDISELREAHSVLQSLNEELDLRVRERTTELERANEELESFSYSVSHDLRAPLRAMSGFSRILLEKYAQTLDDQGQHYLSRISKGAQHMGDLITDLLALSQVTRARLRVMPVDLTAIAHSIAGELQKSAPERRVEIVVPAGMRARGDESLLRIALENLLQNSWKFTRNRSDAKIELAQADKEGRPVFSVRDNGAGFDMAYAAKLFGPFQRLHKESEFEGTGIGLATVARIIHRHGGKIWAEGAVNQGAAFHFTLPPAGTAR